MLSFMLLFIIYFYYITILLLFKVDFELDVSERKSASTTGVALSYENGKYVMNSLLLRL